MYRCEKLYSDANIVYAFWSKSSDFNIHTAIVIGVFFFLKPNVDLGMAELFSFASINALCVN